MSVDVDTSGRARREVSVRVCIVAEERNDNTCVSILILDVSEVDRVRELWHHTLTVFVLRLQQNDWTSVGD